MRIYVAAPVAAAEQVRDVQDDLAGAGHEVTCDWTLDLSLVERFAARPERAAAMATAMLDAVLDAEVVLVLATEHDGRGMFVELGAALARARAGLAEVVVVGEVRHESVFYLHPAVQHVDSVAGWLQRSAERSPP